MKTNMKQVALFFVAGCLTITQVSLPEYARTETHDLISNPAGSKRPDVVFVPTPQEVVNEMLEAAAVKPGERLYDLGCGDGRIAITAAKKYGARATGVDIDPVRIQDSRENARKENLDGKVDFVQADLFEFDFKDADVVTLYLLPKLNVKLRPRLLNELRPGARVVSHSFDMEDWMPDQELDAGQQRKNVYLWIIPAKVAGDWQLTLPNGETGTLSLTQKYQKVDGTLQVGSRTQPIQDAKLAGDVLQFGYTEDGQTVEAVGKIEGDRIAGLLKTGSQESERWAALPARSGVRQAAFR